MTPQQLECIHNQILDRAGEAGPEQDYEAEVTLRNGTVFSGVTLSLALDRSVRHDMSNVAASILQVDSINQPGRSIFIVVDDISAISVAV